MNSIVNVARSEPEKEAEERILAEFANLTNGEVYDQLKKRLLTLKRGVNVVGGSSDYLASDGYELLTYLLQNTLRGVIDSSHEHNKEAHILDVSSGGGEIIDWFYAQEVHRSTHRKNYNMHIIETNKKIIESYNEKVKKNAFLELENHEGKIQDCYKSTSKTRPKFQKPLDFVSFMHAIHHLTDYTSEDFNPYADITNSLKYIYGLLKPGGAIFIAYHDASSEFISTNIDYHKERLSSSAIVERVNKTIKAREELLYDGAILETLRKEDSKTIAKLESHQISSSFYAKTLADMAVIGLSGELLKTDNEKFDNGKLKYLLENIKNSATADVRKGERRKYGLCRAERGREALWRVECPLFICIIRKEIV
ncbi:7028_t:CDS:2 [Acaulospora morrowiae]|uniref:7028_t:CDS:1 n=1 Tax=Acaulospora morrowiae TaxID=94023 RepID=A0A9N9ENZ6_9GLOM|nr:7028_t:CDS:2 [Acaulospora morrowiae]